jgi:DNA polymerase IV
MPMAEARRRCPAAVVIAGRHSRYGEVSADLHEIFRHFTPLVEPIALDEAFLDVAGSHSLYGTSLEIATSLRAAVRSELRLDCSIGIARTKLVAKLASRDAKPLATAEGRRPGKGIVLVRSDEEIAFLHPRPVSDLWGVGPRTGETLGRYGIRTIGDLARMEEVALRRLVGRAAGVRLHALAAGDDRRPVEADRIVKSIGHEETFATDQHDTDRLQAEVVRLSDSVGDRLRAASVMGRTVTLKVRFGNFSTITRSRSHKEPLRSAAEIAEVSSRLLSGIDVSPGVRLIGVTVSSLEAREAARAHQLELLDLEAHEGAAALCRAEVDTALGAIRDRYGPAAVGPATVLGENGLAVKRAGDSAWGPEGGSEAADG